MMKKRMLAAAVVLAIVIAVVVIRTRGNSNDRNIISLSGNVEVTEVNVAFKLPGRVQTLFTDEGKQVTKGERLAVLDNEELMSQVAQYRANFRNSSAQLEKAEKDLERYELLFRQEAISSQMIDAARTGYEVALAQSQQAAAAVRMAEVRLRDTVLYAPAAGVVLRKNVEEGETVQAGVPVFTIGDVADPWIKVYVKEDRLGMIKLGQKAQVTTDTFAGKVYQGVITYISSEAEFTPKNIQTQEERVKLVFGVKITVENRDNELKPGMPADVKILLK